MPSSPPQVLVLSIVTEQLILAITGNPVRKEETAANSSQAGTAVDQGAAAAGQAQGSVRGMKDGD